MRKLFTLILGVVVASSLFAQQPSAVVMKASTPVVIDGVIDDVWAENDSNVIDKPYQTEAPTLGDVGTTYWKALWDEDGMYVLVVVNDDEWRPSYLNAASDNWMYDKPEVYFDVNYVLNDGVGGGGGAGHYQIAPASAEAKIDGTPVTETNGVIYAFKVENPAYVVEYFVPWSLLNDKDGIAFDKMGTMGFDVTVIDKDAADELSVRRRAVWANVGAINESYSNMDDCGLLTFDGADALTEVSAITLTGGVITTNNGTLQIVADIEPADASNKNLKWSVAAAEGSSGRATISSTGVVTAIMDGVVVVNASSTDGSFIDAEPVEVTISNQVVTMDKVNIIRNGNFDLYDETTTAPKEWGGWIDGTYGQPYAVVDGAVSLTVDQIHATEPWHYQFSQSNLTAMPDIPYVLKFKAWASKDRQINFDFEDTSGNGYNRYGVSTDANSTGESEWNVDITTEPTWYTFNVTFTEIIPSTIQKIQFMLSKDDGTVFLDSMYLISEADMALVPAIDQKLSTFEIYPNPVTGNKLNIRLNTENTTVAIYNSVGVKMEEVVVPGTQHTFDVSRYTKGLYIVKANNSAMKFVK